MMVNDVCVKCPFVKNKIKNPLQRKQYVDKLSFYKYLLLYKAKKKGNFAKYSRQKRIWDNLSDDFKKDLSTFMKCDDLGKKAWL